MVTQQVMDPWHAKHRGPTWRPTKEMGENRGILECLGSLGPQAVISELSGDVFGQRPQESLDRGMI